MGQVITLIKETSGSQTGQDKGYWRNLRFNYTRLAVDDAAVIIDPLTGLDVGKGIIDLRGASGFSFSAKNLLAATQTPVAVPEVRMTLSKEPGDAIVLGDGQALSAFAPPGFPATWVEDQEEWRPAAAQIFASAGSGLAWIEFRAQNGIDASWEFNFMLVEE